MKPIRAELRLRNNRLARMREARGFTQVDVAQAIGCSIDTYGRLERMHGSTRYESRSGAGEGWRPACLKLAEFYNVTPEWLFPEDLERIDRTVWEREVGFSELAIHEQPQQVGPGDLYLANEAKHDLEQAIQKLDPRGQYILSRRFGVAGEDKGTLTEVGNELGLSKERTRQIEARALKNLRRFLDLEQDDACEILRAMEQCR